MEVTVIEEENGEPQANVAPTELSALKIHNYYDVKAIRVCVCECVGVRDGVEVSLYELLIRQLQDDGFAGEAHRATAVEHVFSDCGCSVSTFWHDYA
eukprot:5725912-Amphidinium_carterae.1